MTTIAKNICPSCGSIHIIRLPKQTFIEKMFSGSKGSPYQCLKCGVRFDLKSADEKEKIAESPQQKDTDAPAASLKNDPPTKPANWYDDILKDAKTIVGETITKFQDAEMHLKVFETMVKDLKEMKEKGADDEGFEALKSALISQIELIKEQSNEDPIVIKKASEILSYLKPEIKEEENSEETVKKLIASHEEKTEKELIKIEELVRAELKEFNETVISLKENQAKKEFESSLVNELKEGQENVISILNDNIGKMWENFNSVNHIIQKFESRIGTLVGEIYVLREELIKHKSEGASEPEEKSSANIPDILSAVSSKLSLMEMSLLSQWSSMLLDLKSQLIKPDDKQASNSYADLEELKTRLNNISCDLGIIKKSADEKSLSKNFEEFKKNIDDYFYLRKLEISQKETLENLSNKVSIITNSLENISQNSNNKNLLVEFKNIINELLEKERESKIQIIGESLNLVKEDLNNTLSSLTSENKQIEENISRENQLVVTEINQIKEEISSFKEGFDLNDLKNENCENFNSLKSAFSEISGDIGELKDDLISFKADIEKKPDNSSEIKLLNNEITSIKEKINLQLLEISKIADSLKNEEKNIARDDLFLSELNEIKNSYSAVKGKLNNFFEEFKTIKSDLKEIKNDRGITTSDDLNAVVEKITSLQLLVEKLSYKPQIEPKETVTRVTIREEEKKIKKDSFLKNAVAVALALTLFYFGYLMFENDFFTVKKVPQSVPLPKIASTPPAASPSSLVEKKAEEENHKIEEFINKWAKAWEGKNLNEYLSLYSDNFKPSNKTISEWKNTKKYLFSQKGKIKVNISEVEIKRNDDRFFVTFIQNYSFNKNKSRDKKTLTITKESESYKIVNEESEKLK